MAASDSPELRTLQACTPQLETALKGLDSGLVHFLNHNNFITDNVMDKVRNPVTMLTEADKAWELVEWIKNRVKQDPPSYHVLLGRLKQSGNLYKPIVEILEAEYARQNPHDAGRGPQVNQPAGATGNHGNTPPPKSPPTPGLITDTQQFSQMYPKRSYLDAFNKVLPDVKMSIVGSVDRLCNKAISEKLMTHEEKAGILVDSNKHEQASRFLDSLAPKIEVDHQVLALLMNMLSGLGLRTCDQIVLRIKDQLKYLHEIDSGKIMLSKNLPFVLKNILAALDFVPPKKYVRLGVNLGLAKQEVERIEEDDSGNYDRVLIGIISRWMRNVTDPKPSWESLEEALRLTLKVMDEGFDAREQDTATQDVLHVPSDGSDSPVGEQSDSTPTPPQPLQEQETTGTEKSSLQDETVRHQKRYEEIIRDKKTLDMLSVRVVNLGIPRSGKTTFWRRMVDPSAEMKDDEPSTGLVDEQKPVVIKDVNTDTGVLTHNEWLVLNTIGDYARMLLEVFSQVDGSPSGPESSPDAPSEADVAASSSADPQTSTLVEDTTLTASSDIQSSSLESETRSSLIFLLKKALESDFDWERAKGKLEDMILLSTADTGGHAEFLDMHAALINGPSFYLIFSRLKEELDEFFKVHYTDENSVSTKEEDSDSTVKEVLFQALSSITCFDNAQKTSDDANMKVRKSLESRQSKVMFAGTYGDEVNDVDFKKKDAKLLQQIKRTAFYGNVMFAGADQVMLKVDNKSGGADEIRKIREILRTKMMEKFEKIPIPVSWFVLSLLIRDHQTPTMKLHECEVLASKINISPGELQTALWFLHHCLGDILYYPDSTLEDIVFCKIQDIYSSITNLIKNSYTKFAKRDAAVTVFRNLGIFSLKEIERAPEEENSISRGRLVELLRHLKIITPAPSALLPENLVMEEPYLMPCMLRNYKGNSPPCSKKDPKPLLLHFKCGFTPVGIFPALINEMVSQSGEPKWEINPEDGKVSRTELNS